LRSIVTPELRAPNFVERLGEIRIAVEPVRLLMASPRLAGRRATAPRTAVVIPGIGAGDRPLAPLRGFLGRLGHVALPWACGRQGPDVEVTLERFVPRMAEVIDRADAPVALVGWSLGGIVAREAARVINEDRPGSISKVVTFGTPVEGPRHTMARRYYTSEQLDRIDHFVAERRGRSIGCDVVAIHSRNDGVVGWRPCVDHDTPGAMNVEVRSSHLGMGFDPDVWTAVADALE
jgi:predicted alpha/beta hydrolase family esterase